MESLVGKSFYTHNQFLEILLGQGIGCLALYTIWLIFVFRKSLVIGLSGKDVSPGSVWALPLILLTMVINNLAECVLVAREYYIGCLFFLVAGYVCGLARKQHES